MELPEKLTDFLKKNRVGYISVKTPAGRISTNPVTYYFEEGYFHFMTPKASKRFKFMKKDPEVTFTVDNGELMENALGLMVQGKAESYGPNEAVHKIKSIVPKFFKFIKKYPENIPFYALGTVGLNKLPGERKIYKYNFIRINPTKIFYWEGYNFGRIGAKSGEVVSDDPVILAKQGLKGDFSVGEEEELKYDVLDLMNLSESLRRTALALAKFGEAAPEKIAKETNQSISTEKANLDALNRIGYATKAEGHKEYNIMES